MDRENILIVRGAGYIGSHVAKKLFMKGRIEMGTDLFRAVA